MGESPKHWTISAGVYISSSQNLVTSRGFWHHLFQFLRVEASWKQTPDTLKCGWYIFTYIHLPPKKTYPKCWDSYTPKRPKCWDKYTSPIGSIWERLGRIWNDSILSPLPKVSHGSILILPKVPGIRRTTEKQPASWLSLFRATNIFVWKGNVSFESSKLMKMTTDNHVLRKSKVGCFHCLVSFFFELTLMFSWK